MDEKTIYLISAVIFFIALLYLTWRRIWAIGKKNARRNFLFIHRFNGAYPYISPTELQQRVVDLIDDALLENVKDSDIKGIRVELIIKEERRKWKTTLRSWLKSCWSRVAK